MPRQFLIDGYNLAFAWEPVRREILRDKQRGRERLVGMLARFKKAAGCGITVVFDGREGPGADRGGTVQGIRIFYARKPVTADEEIYRMVTGSRDRGRLTVVSSDRQVAGFARRHKASAMGAGEFIEKAERALARTGEKSEKPETVDTGEWARYFGLDDG